MFVGPGVHIGAGSVVGARSSVFRDLPPGMVCTGSPARPVRPVRAAEGGGVGGVGGGAAEGGEPAT